MGGPIKHTYTQLAGQDGEYSNQQSMRLIPISLDSLDSLDSLESLRHRQPSAMNVLVLSILF